MIFPSHGVLLYYSWFSKADGWSPEVNPFTKKPKVWWPVSLPQCCQWITSLWTLRWSFPHCIPLRRLASLTWDIRSSSLYRSWLFSSFLFISLGQQDASRFRSSFEILEVWWISLTQRDMPFNLGASWRVVFTKGTCKISVVEIGHDTLRWVKSYSLLWSMAHIFRWCTDIYLFQNGDFRYEKLPEV